MERIRGCVAIFILVAVYLCNTLISVLYNRDICVHSIYNWCPFFDDQCSGIVIAHVAKTPQDKKTPDQILKVSFAFYKKTQMHQRAKILSKDLYTTLNNGSIGKGFDFWIFFTFSNFDEFVMESKPASENLKGQP